MRPRPHPARHDLALTAACDPTAALDTPARRASSFSPASSWDTVPIFSTPAAATDCVLPPPTPTAAAAHRPATTSTRLPDQPLPAAPNAPKLNRNPPLSPLPPDAPDAPPPSEPPPYVRQCVTSGDTTPLDEPPPNSRACGDQATCIDANVDSVECVYKRQGGEVWLYCPVILTYPRPGSLCALLEAAAPPPPAARRGSTRGGATSSGRHLLQALTGEIDTVCAGDKGSSVLEGPGGVPVPGGINQTTPWPSGNASTYVQWVRWAQDDMRQQDVLFSIRSGSKSCSAASSKLSLKLNGMPATCAGPNFDADGNVMGCQATVDQYNECLWTIKVPRPGGPGWNGDVCVKGPEEDPPAPPPAPSPPRPGAPKKTRAPPLPPLPAAPGETCLLEGPSDGPITGGQSFSCMQQANCMNLYFNSRKCEWRTNGGEQWLYCEVCLTFPRDGATCKISPAADYVCNGDENSLVVDQASGDLVPGGIDVRKSWTGDRQCQIVRWSADDFKTQKVMWSLKSGDGKCMKKAGATVDVQIQGVSATCGNPRQNPFNGFAGCTGNDDVDNECLWTFDIPRPGGEKWTGEVCTGPAPPASPQQQPIAPARDKPPPRRPVRPNQRQPNPPPPKPKAKPSQHQPAVPPASPSGFIPFPFCACKKRNFKNTPYRLTFNTSTPLPTLSDGKPRIRHCFNIDTVSCDPTTSCCGMGLKKIEMMANGNCRKSVKLALLGGQSVSWAFTQDNWQSKTYTTFKFPNLQMTRADVGDDGMSLCFILTDECAKLEDFCYDGDKNVCRTTFFSSDESCCPTMPTELAPGGDPSDPTTVDIDLGNAPPDVEIDLGGR